MKLVTRWRGVHALDGARVVTARYMSRWRGMRASVSLLSADLLAPGPAIDRLEAVLRGYQMDVHFNHTPVRGHDFEQAVGRAGSSTSI